MKRRNVLISIAAVAAVAVVLALLMANHPVKREQIGDGLHVRDGRIVEASGNSFVMRGTNHMYTWFPSEVDTFRDVKKLGANTLRVVLSGGRSPINGPDDVARVVNLCRVNKLICVLEDHDTTGYPDVQQEWTLDRAADYWISVKNALIGQEDVVLINIGNEPFDNPDTGTWQAMTESAISRLRSAGLKHALVVDAPFSGQDVGFAMRDNAADILASDPDRNVVFSIHMYGAFVAAADIASYMDAFQERSLPLIVGEFGDNSDDADRVVKSDANTIMAEANRRGIGYLGWCWSGNPASGPAPHLDQAANFDSNRLTDWGRKLFAGPNGIEQTAHEATAYAP